jgi:hypothetical protein
MNPLHHDPNNHAPPVTPGDDWDHADEAAEVALPVGVVLPSKRAKPAQGQSTAKARKPPPPGLRIDFRMAARKVPLPDAQSPIQSFDGEVVRLEQALDEGPFQASKVIEKVTQAALEEPRDLHGEGKDWGKARKRPLRWLVAGGLGVAVLVIAALAVQELFLMQRKQVQTPPIEWIEEAPLAEVQGFEMDGASEAEARLLVAAYAKAQSPEEVVPLIRNAARLSPRLKLDWLPWHAPPNWEPAREAVWTVTAEGGISHAMLSGWKPDFSRFGVYFVRDEGALKIDWEATEGLSDTSLESLERGLGTGGVIRAHVMPENFYSLTFPEAEFRSFKILAPDRERVIWGYVQLGSPAEAALLKVFEAAKTLEAASPEQAMTLRLTPAPEGSQKNQWIIGEMLHIDWVSP